MSFNVIDGGGPEKEERERQRKEEELRRSRERASGVFSYALRDCAANLLRIVRGAGKPYDLLSQMQEIINVAIKFREVHGYYPPSDLVQSKLTLHDEYEQQQERESQGEVSEESRRYLRENGETDRSYALHVIHRGALQVAASGLIGQDTQQRAGESELHSGLMMWERWSEEQDRRLREAARPSITRRRKEQQGTGGVSPQLRTERELAKSSGRRLSQTRKQSPFDEEDLKELRKAIKAKDDKKIRDLMSKISPRPQAE